MAEKSTKNHDPEEGADKSASGNARATRRESATRPADAELGANPTPDAPTPEAGAEALPEAFPEPEGEPRKTKRGKVKSAPHVVGTGTTDTVYLSALKFQNIHARKSLSVHHLQRRLKDLGYPEAFGDRDGYYGEPTRRSVARFQSEEGIEVPTYQEGLMTRETLEAVFDGDDNVTLSFA